jgi:hypothetical protein
MNEEDLKYLKEEYQLNKKSELEYTHNKLISHANLYKGICRGLSIALIRLGVTNEELDNLGMSAYMDLKGEGVLK